MPIYHQLGQVPRKRHIAFRQPGGALYAEELVGNKGFVGPSSLLYHLRHPTQVTSVRVVRTFEWRADPDLTLRHRHFRTAQVAATRSVTADRIPNLFNSDVAMSFVQLE